MASNLRPVVLFTNVYFELKRQTFVTVSKAQPILANCRYCQACCFIHSVYLVAIMKFGFTSSAESQGEVEWLLESQ